VVATVYETFTNPKFAINGLKHHPLAQILIIPLNPQDYHRRRRTA